MDTNSVLHLLQHQMAERLGEQVYERMKSSKVAVAGLGGLGSNVAVMLARTGVGTLFLVDYDIVEPSNLNRQHYSVKHIGKAKTEALKEQLIEINPFVEIKVKRIRVTAENMTGLFSGYPIVCEAFDQAEEKAMLVNTIMEKLPETKVISGSGMAGWYSSNTIRTEQVWKNLYVCGDRTHAYTQADGIMSPRVMACAAHQANMAVRLLMGAEESGEENEG